MTQIPDINKNPYFRWIGIILGLIAIVLSGIFYLWSIEEPDLTYMINPIKTTIFTSEKMSSLKVYTQGKEIKKDITAIQISIWNQGKKSIKPADILKPIEIYSEPPVEIIEALTRNISREVTHFQIETNVISQGVIKPKWDILENNDGASIQLIFTGPSHTKFKLRGIIEGQKEIINSDQSPKLKNILRFLLPTNETGDANEKNKNAHYLIKWASGIYFLSFVFFLCKGIKLFKSTATTREKYKSSFLLSLVLFLYGYESSFLLSLFSLISCITFLSIIPPFPPIPY